METSISGKRVDHYICGFRSTSEAGRNPSCPSYMDKPLAKHQVATHASRMPSLKVKILESCRDKIQRKILGAFQIKKQHTPINSREEMATALSLTDLWSFKLARWYGNKGGETPSESYCVWNGRAQIYIYGRQSTCRNSSQHIYSLMRGLPRNIRRPTTTTLHPTAFLKAKISFYHLLRFIHLHSPSVIR